MNIREVVEVRVNEALVNRTIKIARDKMGADYKKICKVCSILSDIAGGELSRYIAIENKPYDSYLENTYDLLDRMVIRVKSDMPVDDISLDKFQVGLLTWYIQEAARDIATTG